MGIQAGGLGLQDFPCAVGRAVIDDQNFVGNALEAEVAVEMFNRGGHAPFLVPGGDHDREQAERGLGCRCHVRGGCRANPAREQHKKVGRQS